MGSCARCPSPAALPDSLYRFCIDHACTHKIIKVFTNRHTCQLYERHVQAVDSISRRYKDGFYVSDLPQVQRILSLACDSLLLGHNEFVEPVCGVLRACSEPFLEAKSNEMFRSVDTVCDTIVVIASLMISAPARMISLSLYG